MIPTPKLPNAFTVLALAHREGRGTIILVWLRTNPVTPFATYRMDEEGNCHGGDYCQTCEEGERSYRERVATHKMLEIPAPATVQVIVWQLADDESAYGDKAGWFILTSPDGEDEQPGGPWATEAEAEAHAREQGWKLAAPVGTPYRPGDMAAVYAEENGVSYEQALVSCNMD